MVRFASLLKRTKAYNIIKNLMEKNEDCLILQHRESGSSTPELLTESPTEVEVDLHEETPKRDVTQSFRLNSEFIEKLSELTLENEVFLIGMEEEFKSENLNDYTTIHENKFKNIDLKSFYKRIYGDYVYQNGETFLYNLLDKSENTDIHIEENEPEIPSYFENTQKKTGHYEFDALVDIFSEVRSSVSMVSYTHPINQPL